MRGNSYTPKRDEFIEIAQVLKSFGQHCHLNDDYFGIFVQRCIANGQLETSCASDAFNICNAFSGISF